MAKQSKRQGVAARERHDTLAARLLQRLPGGSFVQEQIDRAEQLVLGELKQRLDRLESSPSVSVVAVSVHTPQHAQGAASPAAMLRDLLTAANEHSHEQSLEESCIAILRSLVPDEARILAALSDGSGYPLLHVMAGPRIGLATFPILEYVSSVGRNAGVLCPELTPAYVRHLAAWGLTETAPENDAQRTQYEMLETDDGVRKAIARIEKNGERARIVRRTLRMSDLGMVIWNMCQIEPDDGGMSAAFSQ
ncbi:MAG TPA: Abi-alpha family protein [Solimonas sp.]|nr:Abi-alpha family protein [Solimonas sp.]